MDENLTKKGKLVLEKAKTIRTRYEKEFLSVLDSKEVEVFKKTLLKLIEKKRS